MKAFKRVKSSFSKSNQYGHLKSSFNSQNEVHSFYSLKKLNDPRLETLPYSIRILLENSLRNNDEFVFTKNTTEAILDWSKNYSKQVEIPFKPSRVLL